MKAYLKAYGGTADAIDPGSAEAYAVGQVVEAVAKKIHSIDNKEIIAALHKGTWPTVEGACAGTRSASRRAATCSWSGSAGSSIPCSPRAPPIKQPFFPKPGWGK